MVLLLLCVLEKGGIFFCDIFSGTGIVCTCSGNKQQYMYDHRLTRQAHTIKLHNSETTGNYHPRQALNTHAQA